MATVGVIGAGAWGTAFSIHLVRIGHTVKLWAYERELVEIIAAERENTMYLPQIRIPEGITPTGEIACACDAEIVVLACPSRFFRGVAQQVVKHLPRGVPVVILTKGFEDETLLCMSEVMEELLPANGANEVAV
ncbi:MAG TPA: glycerol-3-phosphate dehydrogenase, partial [Proteobacteria bacterium]|nr:glycerol-3-phosphate dehydrogenase [Pseudomonadota bacterium]